MYGIDFIMATRPLGYLLPALSGSLKYGEVMGPKWIVFIGQRDRACRGCQGPDQPSPAGAPSAFGGLAGVQRGRQGSTWAETRRGPSRGDPAAHPVGLSELRRGLQLPYYDYYDYYCYHYGLRH